MALTRAEDITPQWLGALLGTNIISFSTKAVGDGMLGESIRFTPDYAPGATGPASIVGKFASNDPVSRQTCAALGLYAAEAAFYAALATTVAIRVPHCLHIAHDETTGDFALLMEDMGPARGGNQLTGCSVADAEAAMVQAAALHGPRWCDPALKATPVLDRVAMRAAGATMMPQCFAVFVERFANVLEPEYMAVCEAVGQGRAAMEPRADGPFALVHGDYRLDNMLFDVKGGAEPLAVLDWQTVAVGSPAVDIAYFMGAALPVVERRTHERRLLELYLSELARRGVHDYPFDALWEDYRRSTFSLISTAIFSTASTKITERGDAMYLSMARGGCAQALDLGTLSALGV